MKEQQTEMIISITTKVGNFHKMMRYILCDHDDYQINDFKTCCSFFLSFTDQKLILTKLHAYHAFGLLAFIGLSVVNLNLKKIVKIKKPENH